MREKGTGDRDHVQFKLKTLKPFKHNFQIVKLPVQSIIL